MGAFVGRIEKGLDFLGYHFGPDGLGVARATIEKFIKRASRLYEQKRVGAGAPDALGMYVRRWMRWASGGLGPAGGSGSVPSFAYAGSTPARHEAQPGEAEGEDG